MTLIKCIPSDCGGSFGKELLKIHDPWISASHKVFVLRQEIEDKLLETCVGTGQCMAPKNISFFLPSFPLSFFPSSLPPAPSTPLFLSLHFCFILQELSACDREVEKRPFTPAGWRSIAIEPHQYTGQWYRERLTL